MNRPAQDLPCWLVVITFDDGSTYRCKVFAASDDRAYELAIQDARMAHVWGQFSGKVASRTTTRLEAETTH